MIKNKTRLMLLKLKKQMIAMMMMMMMIVATVQQLTEITELELSNKSTCLRERACLYLKV